MKAERAVGGGTAALRVRAASPEDLEAVARIEEEAFTNPWRPETFRSLLGRPGTRILVAEDQGEGEPIGYAVYWWVADQGELANLAVCASHRGKGVGSALLEHVLVDAAREGVRSLFLEVRVSNERAHRLYRRYGFVQVATRRDYYRNPREDALVLVKPLPSPEAAVGSGA